MATAYRDRPMQCPQCGKRLAQYDDRDKWRCKACNGVLVGHAQLQVEVGDLAEYVLYEDADPSRVATRPCPVCAFAMVPSAIGGVELDRCENDAIVWFDGGEIGNLRTRIAEANPDEPFITRIVDAVLEAAAEDQATAAGLLDEVPAEPPHEPISDREWQARELCPDGACTGVIGADGTCNVCARTAS